MTYAKKLKDPRWQKKRLEILKRDNWSCQICNTSTETLHVHHRFYEKNKEPWEYSDNVLVTLCEDCHDEEHKEIPKAIEILSQAIMSSGYTSGDIINIALGFSKHKPPHTNEVSACVIEMIISDEKIMDKMTEEYFKSLKKHKNRK